MSNELGFVEDKVTIAQENLGFVETPTSGLEYRNAPPKTFIDNLKNFFRDPEKDIARAQNIYALSQVTGANLKDVSDNYEVLRRSSKVTGLTPELESKEYMAIAMTPLLLTAAVANPIRTIAQLTVFGLVDKAIPTDKWVEDYEYKNGSLSDTTKQTIELLDFVGKGLIVGGMFEKAPKLAQKFLVDKTVEYKLPETIKLSKEQVRDIYQTGKLTTSEQQSLFGSLELKGEELRTALEQGIKIDVPVEKMTTLVDKPIWAKIKKVVGMESKPQIVTETVGKPKQAVSGLLENKVETPVITPKVKEIQQIEKPIELTPQQQLEQIQPETISQQETPKIASVPPPIENIPQQPQGINDPVQKVMQALKEAQPIRREQEILMRKARGEKIAKAKALGAKIGGEKGFQAQLGALKGSLPKASYESLRGKVSQPDIDYLFNKIRSSEINEWDKITAQTGLGKIFGEFGGEVPTQGELKVLHDVFGKEFTDTVLEHRTGLQKFSEISGQVLNLPRSIMSSFDLSAPLRQGIFFAGRKEFLPAFKDMFKFFGSEKALTELNNNIVNNPLYPVMRENNLALTDLDTGLTNREEKFMSSWAEKLPGVRASSRAYTGFLNKLRSDTFTDLYNKAKDLGLDPENNPKLLSDLTEFINAGTGRGKLPGALERAAVNLNSIFFSPRLMASRLQLLNPMFYASKEPFVRKEALKSLFTFLATGASILGLVKMVNPEAEIGNDWRSSDFGKIKLNKKTRIDIWGGFQPYIRMAGQLATGQYVSSTTGKVLTLGEGYKPLTRYDILLRQLEAKEAPIASFITTLLKQQTFTGEKVNIPDEIVSRLTPMIVSDTMDLAKSNPELLPLGILGLFGVGVQTYEEKKKKAKF